MAVVALRPVEPLDAEIFYAHQADPVGAQMAAFASRDRAAYFDHWTRRVLEDPLNIVRTVIVDGAVAGNVVSWLDEDLGRLLGYWIGREFWGRGIATEAVRLYLAEEHERPLHAFVALHNTGSQRVLEKNGFVRVAVQPEIGADGVQELLFVLE